ncbi:hypothetical protein Tco_0321411 [Tanacetum coccineum]
MLKRGRDTKIPQSSGPPVKVGDEAVHKELGDKMERAATTASSLEAEQDSGSSPRCQDTILGDVDAQTRFETTSKQSNDPPLSRGYTLRSGEDSMKLLELMELFNAARPNLVLPVQVNAAEGDSINTSIQDSLCIDCQSYYYTSCIGQFWATAKVKTVNGECQIQALIDKKKVIITETSIRSDLHLEDAGVTQEETQQDDSVPTPSNDPPLSGEDSMQLSELMILCTNLQKQVLDLEKAKDAQAKEIADLKKRVQKLENSLGDHEDASKQVRSIKDIDKDANVSLVDDTHGRSDNEGMFDTNELHSDEQLKPSCFTCDTTTTTTRPKARGVVVQEPSEFRTPQESQPSKIKDKGKAIMIEPEVPLKRKDQVALDEDLARNLQAQLEAELIEEERLARKKEEEANIALIESWDNTQAMMEADFELAQRLQTEEQGEITIEERSRLFVELMNKRKKHFAMLRAKEKRRKPPTKAQKRNLMSTYLKNMVKWQREQNLSSKGSEDELTTDKQDKHKVVRRKLKTAKRRYLVRKEQGKSNNKNLQKDKEWRMIKIKDDDIAIDAIPLATKPLVIVKYKLLKEGIMVHYQLIRAYGSFKRYSLMIRMLQGIDREDLETLWKLVRIMQISQENGQNRTNTDTGTDRVYKSRGFDNKKGQKSTMVNKRNLKIQKMNIKFRGGLLGLKRLHGFLEVTAAQVQQVAGLLTLSSIGASEDDSVGLANSRGVVIALRQIHEDDWEAMDFNGALSSALSVEGKEVLSEDRQEIFINANDFARMLNWSMTLHTTNDDQLHAYLEPTWNDMPIEVRLMHETYSNPLALVASHPITPNVSEDALTEVCQKKDPLPQLLLRAVGTELLNKKDFVDKETYDKLCKCFTTLEKHCITLEADSQLNQEIFQQENSVLNQNAPSFTQLFELSELRAQSQAKDTVIVKLKEQIKSLNGNVDDRTVKMDMDEIETLNIELEHRVTKLVAENEHLKQTYKQLYDSIKPKRVQSKEQCDALIKQVNIKSGEISDLNAKLQEQGLVIAALKNELRKLKGKAVDKEAIETHSVDPNVSKDNMEPITPKLLNKRTAHSSYIKHTQEEALVLRDIVEHVKANYPHDSLLESAFRYTKVIQDLLSHISRSCPSINNFGPQIVEVTPRKKDKKVRFAESLTSIENTKTDSTSNIVSNTRVLHSTGVRLSTSASGSQPSGNTRNDRIPQTPSSNSKNKVEAHPRNVKSSLNKRNGTVKVNGSASVQNSKKQDDSDYVCVNSNDCMSSDNLCVSNSLNVVKFRAKPKQHKSKKAIWKPTGKVFTQIGYIWRPTGRTFTIVGNACPLTRITTTNEVPSRKPIVLDSESPKPVVKLVYSRKPRKNKNTESVSKTKVLKPMSANKQEPSKSWGSTKTNIPSTSLNECRLSKSSSGIWIPVARST